jgi:regulator of protease activity HflC (stomatin/prohibitin superfamily)
MPVIGLIIILIVAFFLFAALNVFKEYERGVVFTLGRFWKVKGPGLVIIIPIIQQVVRLDLRTQVMDVPSQDVITRDNVSVRVNAVVYFRVVDPQRAIIQVENFIEATSQLAQTTLRSVLGQHELDDLLSKRDKLNADIQTILDQETDNWGIKVANVEIRRAKIINAEGELQSAEKLQEAAVILCKQPQSIQLRYMQTLMDIAGDRTNTIVFPMPMELLKGLLGDDTAAVKGAVKSKSNVKID